MQPSIMYNGGQPNFQVAWHLQFEEISSNPYFAEADWQDAEILPPPTDWGGGLPDGKLPPISSQFDPASGKPLTWPIRYTVAHWAALVPAVAAGEYELRCRTIDAAGKAQPMPRPFPKAGRNEIRLVRLTVEG